MSWLVGARGGASSVAAPGLTILEKFLPVNWGAGGGIYVGMYPGADDYTQFQAMGKSSAPYMAIYKRYVSFDNVGGNGQFPDATDSTAEADGSIQHFSWVNVRNSSSYDTGVLPTPAQLASGPAGKDTWTYAQIYNGSCDTYLAVVAARLAAMPGRFLIDFNHEMEAQSAAPSRRYSFSNPADPDWTEYGQAVRHIKAFMLANGVTNAIWCVTYAALNNSLATLVQTNGVNTSSTWAQAYANLYPGDDYVDILCWDPYQNDGGSGTNFASILATGYNLFDSSTFNAANCFYAATNLKTKPRGCSEFGNMAGTGTPAAWITSLPTAFAGFPKIVEAQYFLSSTSDFSGNGTLSADWVTGLANSYFNPTPTG